MSNEMTVMAIYDGGEEVVKFSKRIKMLVKGGDKLSDNEAMALAQITLATGLNPFVGEVWYIPGKGPMVGIVGSRRLENEAMEKKHGYSSLEFTPVDGQVAGCPEASLKDLAAAFRCDLYDSVARNEYNKGFVELLNNLRELKSPDPFKDAKELMGPKPVWTGYGYALRNESSTMAKVQLARKRAEADALKKRIIIPLGGRVSDNDLAPAYEAEVIDAVATDPKPRRNEDDIMAELGYAKKPATPAAVQTFDPTRHATRVPEKLKADLTEDAKVERGIAGDGKLGLVVSIIDKTIGKTGRYDLTEYLFGVRSSTQLKDNQVHALFQWLDPVKDKDTNAWIPSGVAIQEMQTAYQALLKAAGQQTIPGMGV